MIDHQGLWSFIFFHTWCQDMVGFCHFSFDSIDGSLSPNSLGTISQFVGDSQSRILYLGLSSRHFCRHGFSSIFMCRFSTACSCPLQCRSSTRYVLYGLLESDLKVALIVLEAFASTNMVGSFSLFRLLSQ